MSDHRAAQIVTARSAEKAYRCSAVARLKKEILDVRMNRIRSGDRNRICRIAIGAKEITEIAKPSVIFMIYGKYKLLYSVGSLENKAVILQY